MKIIYWVWLLSRDEGVLKALFIAFAGAAAISYLLAGIQTVPTGTGSYKRLQVTPDSRLVLPP